jgi:undecaprenyl-diphosphatase
MLASILDRILSLHGWVALAIVFGLPALEASAFVGFVFPGEIAVLLGGVLAFQHRIGLTSAIVAAVSGAIVGDSVGYFIGKRWGRHILRGTIGHLPLVKHHLDKNLDKARDYLRRRGGRAVLIGRFTAALRVLVPGLAGMSDFPYHTFFLFNALGGLIWGAGFVLLGYFGGDAWRRVEKIAGRVGLGLLGLIVLGLVIDRLGRNSDRLQAFGDRLAALRFFAWIRRRFPGPVGWTRRRLEPSPPTGFTLTFAVSVGALFGWAFGILTQDVFATEESVLWDPRVESFVVAHRDHALTVAMQWFTWLGSNAVLVPMVLVVGGWFVWNRREWKPFTKLAVALGGAIASYDIVQPLVARPRPPAADRIVGALGGWSFPSGHATQAVAAWGMLALILAAGRSVRRKAELLLGALLIVLVVGASRIYLGAHWFTDVLGGYALGGLWLCIVVAATLILSSRKSGRNPPPKDASRTPNESAAV